MPQRVRDALYLTAAAVLLLITMLPGPADAMVL